MIWIYKIYLRSYSFSKYSIVIKRSFISLFSTKNSDMEIYKYPLKRILYVKAKSRVKYL